MSVSTYTGESPRTPQNRERAAQLNRLLRWDSAGFGLASSAACIPSTIFPPISGWINMQLRLTG
ncbi:hypothetical protein BO99DRAFT_404948 [Aspergillus violaceofuscus CBS 115571]|uniref:Uncharacterized protein n=1 Tax=Aspergillus violaceofuscus (strain CBS 115571) TaxID=1450538 RepID=A0A2V5GYP1_ASPV1|nr:hypothetical protein BO99DRAFT_404948 [Aspergillus violaceofuscus CBS 115571]